MIGEVLDKRYKILREIGAGGMAWVYEAQDLQDDTRVAVKVLYPQYNRDQAYVERFLREAQLALRIASEHIVRILGYGSDRDRRYLVMELIQGHDLATHLRQSDTDWRQALEIGLQVARALDAANAQGVVHRDIKPQNIMLTEQGTVKVLDFGIARARELPSVTQGGFVGSPSYISPEQGMGKRVDTRSDIYSLGVVLYETICGTPPFQADTPWAIIRQHITQEPPKLSLRVDSLPPVVEALVRKMLAKAPQDRYQTPGELQASMQEILSMPDGSPGLAQPALPSQQAQAQERAHKLLLSSMYQRALDAAQSEEWPQAVNLLQQILKVDPKYPDAAQHLVHAARQARLAALYGEAQRALAEERWQEAVDELGEIVGVDARYRDAAELLTQAGMSLAEHKTQERLADLYLEGSAHHERQEWPEAEALFGQIIQIDADYRDAARLAAESKRRARWAKSLLGRTSRSVAQWLAGSSRTEQPSEQ